MNDEYDIFSFEYDKKSKKKVMKWDISTMMKTKFKQRGENNPSFYRVFDPEYNLTKPFFKDLAFRTTGERNVIIEITGGTGSGKSLVSITIAVKVMKKPITIDDICFTIDQLLDRSKNIGKSHVMLQDEQINMLGAGSNREQYEKQTLEDTTRKFGLSIIFCSPTTREHTTAHYNLEIICRNNKKRITKVAIIGDKGQYIGYFVIKVLGVNNKLWKAYEVKKDEFIEGVLNRSTARLSLNDMSKALIDDPQFYKAKTRNLKKVLAVKMFPTLTIYEIEMIVDNINFLD